MRFNQPHGLATAIGMHRLRKLRDFPLGIFEIAEPKLRITRKTNPHGLVRSPFGKWRTIHTVPLTARVSRAKLGLAFLIATCTIYLPSKGE